jgi:hypothetical protein
MEKLIFVSAQPDLPYFHWQVKLYINSFIENQINPNQIHVIFGILENSKEPSDGAIEILKTGVNVHFYKDLRTKKQYIPSIKPYLIYNWIKENEERGRLFFLHDSDIILTKKLNVEDLLNDEVIYMSDTENYLGYQYLKNCSNRYSKNFEKCGDEELIDDMLSIIGLNKKVIIDNQKNSGGAQYIIKNTDSKLWEKIYINSIELYNKMMIFQKKYPIKNGKVQFWTAEMWSLLWNLWRDKKLTKITSELDFSWATDDVQKFFERPILHMAGVTDDMKHRKFYKGSFLETDPIELLRTDSKHFDYIEPKSITTKYIENMKSYIKKTKN